MRMSKAPPTCAEDSSGTQEVPCRATADTDLQELEADVREAAGAQLGLQGAERGEQLQGDDGAQARPHGRGTLIILQLPQPQAPDGCRVDVLVLPPGGRQG